MRMTLSSGLVRFVLGWLAVFAFRLLLLPFRAPNVEPMMATVMPFAKRFGMLPSFLFGFLGIVLYDAVTSGWGIWTAVTALAYGLVGIAAHTFFARRAASRWNFFVFGMTATLFYDIVTGLTVGPLFFHQPFALALAGQVPFTLLHLAGTAVFSLTLSPAIYRWVAANESLSFSTLRLGARA